MQVNELVIGNVDGVLAVFKGPSTTPFKKCSGLGTVSLTTALLLLSLTIPPPSPPLQIVCVGIGDVLNTGKV